MLCWCHSGKDLVNPKKERSAGVFRSWVNRTQRGHQCNHHIAAAGTQWKNQSGRLVTRKKYFMILMGDCTLKYNKNTYARANKNCKYVAEADTYHKCWQTPRNPRIFFNRYKVSNASMQLILFRWADFLLVDVYYYLMWLVALKSDLKIEKVQDNGP